MKYLTALAAALIATSVGPPAPARSAIERLQSYRSSVGQHTRSVRYQTLIWLHWLEHERRTAARRDKAVLDLSRGRSCLNPSIACACAIPISTTLLDRVGRYEARFRRQAAQTMGFFGTCRILPRVDVDIA
jgi:hypothetical protein